jgi:hypothetical protein
MRLKIKRDATMTDAPEIFDGHAYCFPDVRKLMGFPSLEEQQIHVQKSDCESPRSAMASK